MTLETIKVELTNKLAELDALCDRVEDYCLALGMSRKEVFQIRFALEEIFVNIVSYGYTDGREHRILVTVGREDDKVAMRLEDDGIPFNPLDAAVPDTECPIEERQVGGLGVHLTKHLMGEITYQRIGDRNVLTIKKPISSTGQ